MRELSTNGKVGQIQISDEVLAIISGTAAHEVEGVISGRVATEIFLKTRRNFARGVKITIAQDKVIVDIKILVRFGFKIHEISQEVQKRVKNALETMVGMKVSEVNVSVVGIQLDKVQKSVQKPRKRR